MSEFIRITGKRADLQLGHTSDYKHVIVTFEFEGKPRHVGFEPAAARALAADIVRMAEIVEAHKS